MRRPRPLARAPPPALARGAGLRRALPYARRRAALRGCRVRARRAHAGAVLLLRRPPRRNPVRAVRLARLAAPARAERARRRARRARGARPALRLLRRGREDERTPALRDRTARAGARRRRDGVARPGRRGDAPRRRPRPGEPAPAAGNAARSGPRPCRVRGDVRGGDLLQPRQRRAHEDGRPRRRPVLCRLVGDRGRRNAADPDERARGRLRVPLLEPLGGRRVPASRRRGARLLRGHAPDDRGRRDAPRRRQARDAPAPRRRLQRHAPLPRRGRARHLTRLPPARRAGPAAARALRPWSLRGRLARARRQLPALARDRGRGPGGNADLRADRARGGPARPGGARPARSPGGGGRRRGRAHPRGLLRGLRGRALEHGLLRALDRRGRRTLRQRAQLGAGLPARPVRLPAYSTRRSPSGPAPQGGFRASSACCSRSGGCARA